MKLSNKLEDYRNMAHDFLAAYGYSCSDVTTGLDAWTVAHRSGITADAYAISRDIKDAHIQTVLEQIFPNAVFRDSKRY